MRLETEIKIPISDPAALRRHLSAAGFRPGPRRRELNWLLDDPSGRLSRTGLLLRLRRSAGRWLLTAKGPRRQSRLKIRPESEISLPDGRALLAVLALVNLRPRQVYERDRTIWHSPRFPGLEVAWDHTPIGDLLELEGPAASIRRATRLLGFSLSSASAASYPDLFRAWARQHQYRGQEFTFAALRHPERSLARHNAPRARRPARRR